MKCIWEFGFEKYHLTKAESIWRDFLAYFLKECAQEDFS